MLRSELRALRNTFRTKEGQQALVGTVIVLACLLALGLALGSMLTEPDWVLRLAEPGLLEVVVVGLLLLAALVVLAFARVPCRNQLFVGSHVAAWLASPAGSRRIMAMVWLRQVSGAWLATSAIAGIPMLAVVVRGGLSICTAVGFLIALMLVVGAALAGVLLAVVVATRFGSGGRWRQVLLLLHLTFVLTVVVLLLSGVGRGEQLRSWMLNLQLDGHWLLAAFLFVAQLPVQLGAGSLGWQLLLAPVCLVALIALTILVAASLYRRAFEAFLCATPSGRIAQPSGAWPRSAAASLVRRGFVEAWRARGGLVLVSLFGAMAVWRPAADPFVPWAEDSMHVVREVFFLQGSWLPLNSVLAMLLFLGVIGDEQKQLALLATSPVSRGDLLRSRIVLLGWPFVLTVVMAALSGKLVGGVSWLGTIGFVVATLPCVLVLLGCCLAVGSWPAFIALRSDVPLASNVRSVVPVLVLSVVAFGLAYAQHSMRTNLLGDLGVPSESMATAVLLLVAAWACAAALFVATCRLARRNFTTLLGPQ